MDVWVVAAAAGAGYVAQHWKDFIKGGLRISDSSSSSNNSSKPEVSSTMQQLQNEKGLFHKLGCRKNAANEFYEEREPMSKGDSTANMSSTSGLDGGKLEPKDSFEVCDTQNQTCSSSRFLNNYDVGDFSESSKPSTREKGSIYTRRILRSNRTKKEVLEPVNSLQSCLMSQIYNEHAEMEDYVLKSSPLPAGPTVKHLLVTDGTRIIGRGSSRLNNVQTRIGDKKGKEVSSTYEASVVGVPPLPNAERGSEDKTIDDKCQRLSSSSNVILSQGPSHEAVLFGLGISIGILFSRISYRQEVEKLNDLLKQKKDLVQDLQEELDMKESLIVKEIAVKDHENMDKNTFGNEEEIVAFSSEQNFVEINEEGQLENCYQRVQEESMRKIEAELEAELATLELNMSSSTLDAQISDLLELDEECVPDIAQGELRANIFGRQAPEESYADRDGSGNSTPHLTNYAVSPRELSLRLHEVLESRLEERVKELETALENSVRKTRYIESEQTKLSRQLSILETGSSSAQGSPTAAAVIHVADDVYTEGYNEFSRENGSEDEGLLSGVEVNHQEKLSLLDQNSDEIEDGWVNQYIPRSTTASPTIEEADKDNISPNEIGSNNNNNNNGRDEEYCSDSNDEMDKLLIKQILEKRKQGSPAVLNARRILFSLDEN